MVFVGRTCSPAQEEALVNKHDGGIADMASFKKRFWRDSPEARREALLPFVWGVVARHGQIYGNRWKGSEARVTNGLKFSYPGYQETLCGFADPRIRSNEMGPNPNVSVLEWLNRKDAYRGRVAAFGAWDAFDRILNRRRCGFCVNAGFAPLAEGRMNAQIELLNRLKQEMPRQWDNMPPDAIAFHTALEYLKQNKPRVLYVSLGETDEWGHEGRYDEYLTAAQRADRYLRTLWETAQAMPEYRGRTTLIFSPTTDAAVRPAENSRGEPCCRYRRCGNDLVGGVGARHAGTRRAAQHSAGYGKPDRRHAGRFPRGRLRGGRSPSRQADRRRVAGSEKSPGGTGYRPLTRLCLSPRIPPMKRFCRPMELPLTSLLLVLSLALAPQECSAWGERTALSPGPPSRRCRRGNRSFLGKEGQDSPTTTASSRTW